MQRPNISIHMCDPRILTLLNGIKAMTFALDSDDLLQGFVFAVNPGAAIRKRHSMVVQ
ncbi:hypothetical protein JXA80_01255 [bacterium]|nr:hypothetical protein [candidate division CSSED10-310 bacterium]